MKLGKGFMGTWIGDHTPTNYRHIFLLTLIFTKLCPGDMTLKRIIYTVSST